MLYKILTIVNSSIILLTVIGVILNKTVFKRYCFCFPWIRIDKEGLWVGYRTLSGSGSFYNILYWLLHRKEQYD